MFTLLSTTRNPRIAAVVLTGIVLCAAACGGGSAEAPASVPAASTNQTDSAPQADSAADQEPAPAAAVEDASDIADVVADLAEGLPTESGGGTITLDGVEYVFETEFCANDEDGMFNEGSGVGPDGERFTAAIFVQPFLENVLVTAELTLGQDHIYSPPSPDQPAYETNSLREAETVFTIAGTRVSGSGPAIDLQDVALADGETVSMMFEGQCGDSPSPVIQDQ